MNKVKVTKCPPFTKEMYEQQNKGKSTRFATKKTGKVGKRLPDGDGDRPWSDGE